MATITPVVPVVAGVAAPGVAAAGGGDQVANPDGTLLLRVANGGGGSINVTAEVVMASRPAGGFWPAMTLADIVVAVPAGETRLIGPIPKAYNDISGNVQLTYSGVTSVTVLAIQP